MIAQIALGCSFLDKLAENNVGGVQEAILDDLK
jgi:hypothetical protein